jgi:hypothetical protein
VCPAKVRTYSWSPGERVEVGRERVGSKTIWVDAPPKSKTPAVDLRSLPPMLPAVSRVVRGWGYRGGNLLLSRRKHLHLFLPL